jgi:hypothetical protein
MTYDEDLPWPPSEHIDDRHMTRRDDADYHVDEETRNRIIEMWSSNPELSAVDICIELAGEGIDISPTSVQLILEQVADDVDQ